MGYTYSMLLIRIEPLQQFLRDQPELLFAYLFGSYANGQANALSDVDIAVYASAALSTEHHEQLLSALIDLLRRRSVDLIDLRAAPPVLAYEVITTGKPLFVKDTDEQNHFERRVFLHYFDTHYLRATQNRYLREHLQT